jgi:hypothetical protein
MYHWDNRKAISELPQLKTVWAYDLPSAFVFASQANVESLLWHPQHNVQLPFPGDFESALRRLRSLNVGSSDSLPFLFPALVDYLDNLRILELYGIQASALLHIYPLLMQSRSLQTWQSTSAVYLH